MTLKAYLLERKMTASELATELNVSVASISRWNHGQYIEKVYRSLCNYRPYIVWEIPKGPDDYWKGVAVGLSKELNKQDDEIKQLKKEIKYYNNLIKDINKIFNKIKEKIDHV